MKLLKKTLWNQKDNLLFDTCLIIVSTYIDLVSISLIKITFFYNLEYFCEIYFLLLM